MLMKKIWLLPLIAALATVLGAEPPARKLLFVYDEVNKQSSPYIGYFRDAFAAKGIIYDEAAAAELKAKDLSSYKLIVVYGMVMAFNTKSPIRDWLRTAPDLGGKKVSLFVTANRWYLKQLSEQLLELLKDDKAEVVDAVSMATKNLDNREKSSAVDKQVEGLK
jgi:hypothetical protein